MKVSVVGARGIPAAEGGAEKNAENLFPMVARAHDVTLYAIQGDRSQTAYKGVRLEYAPKLFVFGTEKLPCYLYAFLRSLREAPDVVHLQGLGSALFLGLYKLFGFKVVVRYGSADYDMKKWSAVGRWGFRFSEWQLRFADAVIAVTPSLKKRLDDRGLRMRTEIIPNALDPVDHEESLIDTVLEQYGLERGRFVLGIGRLTAQKDFVTLIQAFRRYRERGGDRLAKLVIVGGDDHSGYYQSLKALAGPDVVFTGRLPRPQVHALLPAAGLYVNSSVHEGMSNAVLEAVSHQAPILLSDIVENRDLPIHERHFFTCGDPEMLAGLIGEAAKDPATFVTSKAPFAEWSDVAERTLTLYDSLFDEKPVPARVKTRPSETPTK